MSDAVDDAMEDEDEGEGEEVESDKILKEVMDEIGMGMNDAVSATFFLRAGWRSAVLAEWAQLASAPTANPMAAEAAPVSRVAVAEGLVSSPGQPPRGDNAGGGGGGGPMSADEMDLQKRLDALRRD